MQRSGALIRRSLAWLARRSRPQQVLTVLGMQRSDPMLPASWLLEHPRVQLWADAAALSLA